MSGDKRSVATDALEVLGTIITDKDVGRDAIHLACEPVIAGEAIVPGQDISVKDGVALTTGKWVGIADPFIEKTIPKGSKFLCVIYPRMILWEYFEAITGESAEKYRDRGFYFSCSC